MGFDINKMMKVSQDVILKPVPTFEKHVKDKVELQDGMINYAIAFAISAVLSSIAGLIYSLAAGGQAIATTLLALPIALIIGVILGIVFSLIGAGITHLIATLLGGKAPFKQLYYMLSLIALPAAVVTGIFSFIPCLGDIATLIFGFYVLYIQTMLYKQLYKFDTLKAVAVWLIPLIIVGAIMILLFLLMGAMILSMFGGALGGAALGSGM